MGGPFTRILDFPPFNIDSGPQFLAIYLVIAVCGAWLAKAARVQVVARREKAARAASAANEQPAGYRIPAERWWTHWPLTIGSMPMREEHLRIAYLKGGLGGVASALVASAVANGWLAPDPSGAFGVGTPPAEVLAEEQALFREVDKRTATITNVMAAARKVAGRWATPYEDDLLRAGHLRSDATRAAGRWAVIWIGVAILAIGAARAARGIELQRPIALLVVMMIGVVIAIFVIARVERISTAGKEYLAWLDATTTTLRADVQAGRDRVPTDILLAASLAGMFVVPDIAMAATASPQAVRSFAAAGATSGSPMAGPGSSCSSASCGGGGGCGGGGCGGGGCGG
jgi:uncharacterized protein (TIGR04222 family)